MTGPYIGCVYLATCRPNGKIYIGKSIHGLEWRKRTHERYARSGTVIFLHALKKHGLEAFDWCEMFLSDDDRALVAAETKLIADHRMAGFELYNMTNGGDGCAGRKVSAEQLEKMRQPRTEAVKAALRAGQTPEVRAAKAAYRRGKTLSVESRAKVSAAQRGKPKSPEHIAKIQASRKNITMPPWSAERRAKMEAAWERWRDTKEYKTTAEFRAIAYRSRKKKPG